MRRSVAVLGRLGRPPRLPPSLRRAPAPAPYQTRGLRSLAEGLAALAPATPSSHRHAQRATLRGVRPQHLYRIINDVGRYAEFLPHCRASEVLRTSGCGTLYDAALEVGLPGVAEERYVSRVRATPPPPPSPGVDDAADQVPVWTVEAKSIRSRAFDSLKSRWRLTHADDGAGTATEGAAACRVRFEVEVRVSNPLLSLALDRVLREVARVQVAAFERRCHELFPVTH